jgi:HEAT repeat protein
MAENGRRKGEAALLVALAAGHTVRDAARLAGIGERTATRRMADPDFRRRLMEARSGMIQRALGKLADGSTKAVDTLRKLLKAKGENVRLGAARAILEFGSKMRETVELEARLAILEERMAGE